jgi:NADH-quinone oxidoreductase subunit J
MWDNLIQFITNGENIVFIILAIFVISGAVLMISFTKVVHMVIALATTFIGLAGLYLLLHAEFVAFVQVMIYGGAVTILMLFGVMMTKHESHEEEPRRPIHNNLLFIGVVVFFGVLFFSIQRANFPVAQSNLWGDNTHSIGELLFTQYVIPFELVSVLLTVAFIGAIVIAKREEE